MRSALTECRHSNAIVGKHVKVHAPLGGHENGQRVLLSNCARRLMPHPAATIASRRQVLEASATMVVAAAGTIGGQTAGEALAAQSSGPDQQGGRPPEMPCDLTRMRAHWVTRDLIAWPAAADAPPGTTFQLLHSRAAGLSVEDGSATDTADDVIQLQPDPAGLPREAQLKFPHLASLPTLRLPPNAAGLAPQLLQGQLAVAVVSSDGKLIEATGLQLPGVLDELFTYSGPLGAEITESAATVIVWAPTAQHVELLVYDGPRDGSHVAAPMSRADAGQWTAKGPGDWLWRYYTYRVTVYCPWTQRIEVCEVTDPYSVALAADGARSQFARLDAPHLFPDGWREHRPPPLAAATDASIYELHIRDFSTSDNSVPAGLRGKYGAFTLQGSRGGRHLRELAAAGLTHVHLLPLYDFATVPERPEDQRTVDKDLSGLPPDSEEQQEAVLAVAQQDAFNWGYDPVHYSTPEGGYAVEVDGAGRTHEVRQMVQGLHSAGLRVVLDVVYNHGFNAGPHSRYSVLDKIVPAYYHRLEPDGSICGSAFGANNAPEHAMMERLVLDDLLHWARQYRVDGFRFDIMSCLMVSTMAKARDALRALTTQKDGVDGAGMLLYGEGWDFGEVTGNQRGRNASQLNLAGTGIGSFNDRLRDAVLGGSPFAPSREQGFVNGLALQSNAHMTAALPPPDQRELLGRLTDAALVSLAGNLRSFELEDHTGRILKGRQVLYNGTQPAGYASEPCETVNYVSCHDGEVLFDQLVMKPQEQVTAEARACMATLAQWIVALSQGIVFFHAGDELLRSKSLDRDSYDSGDWFNWLDWSGMRNNFGVGLPVASKNAEHWPEKRPFLARKDLRPAPELIQRTKAAFLAALRVRYSSPLFRLPTAAAIRAQLRLHNTGPQQVPGLIVMELLSADAIGATDGVHDPQYERIIATFNARPEPHLLHWPSGAQQLQLHPDLPEWMADAGSAAGEAPAGATWLPARSAVVLVQPRQ